MSTMKERAALRVAYNWRIQRRLPRITAFARSIGLEIASPNNEFPVSIFLLLGKEAMK